MHKLTVIGLCTVLFLAYSNQAAATEVVMYKNANCNCCADWAKHLQANGFSVTENVSTDMPAIKAKHGVPRKLSSCHTAIIDGYIVEGHVPASDIKRLLKERPKVTGLTAPGMPKHSPGMQATGLKPHSYDVLSFDKDGSSQLFTHY